MSRALSLAGFQVTIIGRFWVTTEAERTKLLQCQKQMLRGSREPIKSLHHDCVKLTFASVEFRESVRVDFLILEWFRQPFCYTYCRTDPPTDSCWSTRPTHASSGTQEIFH